MEITCLNQPEQEKSPEEGVKGKESCSMSSNQLFISAPLIKPESSAAAWAKWDLIGICSQKANKIMWEWSKFTTGILKEEERPNLRDN